MGPLAQSAERGANNAKAKGSSPLRTSGDHFGHFWNATAVSGMFLYSNVNEQFPYVLSRSAKQ